MWFKHLLVIFCQILDRKRSAAPALFLATDTAAHNAQAILSSDTCAAKLRGNWDAKEWADFRWRCNTRNTSRVASGAYLLSARPDGACSLSKSPSRHQGGWGKNVQSWRGKERSVELVDCGAEYRHCALCISGEVNFIISLSP